MKIFNETKTIELTKDQCDLVKGRLKEDKAIINGKEEYIWVYTLYTQKELYEREIDSIKYWFETEYREQFEKCTRKIALGITMRDGTNPQIALDALYSQAEVNANRINELKNLLNA